MLWHSLVVLLVGANPDVFETRYSDAAGAHLVRFEVKSSTRKVGDDWEKTLTLTISDAVGKKVIWKAKDFVERCAFDATLALDRDSLQTTDLDGDGVKEISFLYSLGCRSDVSPLTVKLLMYEGATKYALRGQSRERVSETEYVGGTFEPDPSFASAPGPFLERAKRTWNERVNGEK